MKNFLILIFLLGMFAVGCSHAFEKAKPQSAQTEFVQVAGIPVHATVMNAVDETALPVPDNPTPVKWLDENTLLAVGSIIGIVYEFLARKIPTSKTLSIVGNLYKLLNWFIPDKSKNGGELAVRDKL